MATKTKTEPVTAEVIKSAVETWVKAETSAIWGLIKVVSRGLIGFNGADRETRVKALKTWVNQAAEELWGKGAANDRAAHISKIFKIAENATNKHYERWEKEGTGFYKAYSEFAVPQSKPASGKKSAGPSVVSVPTDQLRAEAKGEGGSWTAPEAAGDVELKPDEPVDPAIAATKPKTQGPGPVVEGYSPAAAAAATAPEPDTADYTVGWASRIDADERVWGRLLEHMTDKRHTILRTDMVVQVFIAAEKRPQLFRGSIAVMLQTDFIKDEVVEFIKQNPQMFEGISVNEPQPAVAAGATN